MKLYCIDDEMKNLLVSKGMQLITTNKNSNKNVYVFDYNPKQYSLNFSDSEVRKKCILSDKLLMTF